MIGNGKVVSFQKETDHSKSTSENGNANVPTDAMSSSFFEGEVEAKVIQEETKCDPKENTTHMEVANRKKSWAMLVNPTAASPSPFIEEKDVNNNMSAMLGSMTLSGNIKEMNAALEEKADSDSSGGQFSDAEDDESIDIPQVNPAVDESSEDGNEFASIGDDFSDEECDVYVLDPEEVEEKERSSQELEKQKLTEKLEMEFPSLVAEKQQLTEELEMEFPSLAAASTVPYEGSDDEIVKESREVNKMEQMERLKKAAEEEERRKAASLQPISKSGKLYNSLGRYKNLVSTKGLNIGQNVVKKKAKSTFSFAKSSEEAFASRPESNGRTSMQSRVIGDTGMSGQSNEVDDDGEGWVTSTKEIVAMKATGTLDPFRSDKNQSRESKPQENLPLKNSRTACATTDFAMQNVILQMNLELLTVDGVRVRKLKSWVQRCSTCFKVYTSVESSRMFCGKCGSSSIQRIAASVDGKTGRLKLHLKKNYQHNLRGTKFNLPTPGKQNRFMGDLLLCEDQLMFGALNHRAKQSKSKNAKASQSIFGADIASTVGCNADLSKRGDIKVGFGRKNPNATKFGRERRGKKKKSGDKICGLRRY